MKRLISTRVLLILIAFLCAAATAAAADVRTLVVPNGFYGEALPTGEYAVLVPGSHVETHLGVVALPTPLDEPLFLRITAVGGFRFAGQDHNSGAAEEYRPGVGWSFGAVACGVSPVIYDLAGTLRISDCSIGSQGWRYVAEDGTLVTGDATYGDAALNLFEWTRYGDITIGQGGSGGCIAVRGADRRMLQPGDCRFVRFNRTGDALAVTMVKSAEHRTVIVWLQASDLDTFPVDAPPPPATPAPPAPAPVPVPSPAPPVPHAIPNHQADLQALRNQYPAVITIDQDGELMARLAYLLRDQGFGLLRKDGGHNCSATGVAVKFSCDWIIYQPTNQGCDVIGNSPDVGNPTAATVSWCDGDPNPGEFVKVTSDPAVGAGPAPQPPPPVVTPPAPAPDPTVALNARIQQLEAALAEMTAERDQLVQDLNAVRQEEGAIIAERDALKAKPLPSCQAKVPAIVKSLGIKIGCTVIQP